MNIKAFLLSTLLAQMCFCWGVLTAGSSDSDSDCYRKIVSCIQCSSETHDPGSQLCRDPFDAQIKKEFKRLYHSNPVDRTAISKYNITTVMCDGFCIKWVKVPLTGGGSHIVRTCSTSMDIKFSQNTPVCILESRTGKGTMCFCKDTMCNGAATPAAGEWIWILQLVLLLSVVGCATCFPLVVVLF